MKRGYIFGIVFLCLLAFIIPANAACPLEKKQCNSDAEDCSLDQSSCALDSCKNVKNCGNNNDNCKLDKTTKCAEKKEACDLKSVKKEKCAVVNKKACNTVKTANTGCGTDGTLGVSPAVPGDAGTTTVKMCKNNVCTVGGDGKVLTLTNYPNATDPTYEQLITFLEEDKTDEIPYTSTYICSDFSRTLHNNLEAAGYRAGWIGIESCNHAFNMVNTSDKGLIYIDCTGVPGGASLQDKELNYVKGSPLTGAYLFQDGTVQMGCYAGDALIYW